MPIHIIRADLSNLPHYVDFIVNTANPEPKVGNGLDKSIYTRAGSEMLEERKQIGVIASGDIAITNAYGLNAKKVVHAVTVAWTDGFHDELACVQKCYHKSLAAAVDYMQNHSLLSISIAMPLIGTGIYQIPLESCMSIAIFESMQFALTYNMDIYLVLFDERSVSAMEKAFPVEEYISYESSRDILQFEYTKHQSLESPESIHNSIKQTKYYLLEMQPKKFVDLLRYYMRIKEMDGTDIYKPICLTRQSFSDIISGNKAPKKETVILIAMQLKLSFQEFEEFLEKAGYSLSDDKQKDRLVKTFFTSECYDIIKYQDMRDALDSKK